MEGKANGATEPEGARKRPPKKGLNGHLCTDSKLASQNEFQVRTFS